MIPDFSGDFLNFESTKDGDICEILNEGKVEYSEALKKDLFNIQVKLNEKVKIYSPTNKVGQELQKAFGEDTVKWKGCKFQIVHAQGKMLIRPIRPIKI